MPRTEPEERPIGTEKDSTQRHGLAAALSAYLLWGFMPLYWKQLVHVPPDELIAHRVLGSLGFAAALLTAVGRWGELRAALAGPARRAMLLATLLIGTNWWLFIVTVNAGHVTQASLGYYVNPLVSVLLGRVVLGERLSRVQAAAVALAAAGVLNLAIGLGQVPWASLALAGSFGLYGLVRKRAPVAPLPGLGVESLLLAPVALAWLAWLLATGESVVPHASPKDLVLMLGSGAATGVPMLFFTAAARRLRLSTLGIVQFVSPTCQLGLAVLLYGEPFTRTHAVTFACIWAAVALYAAEGLVRARRAVAG